MRGQRRRKGQGARGVGVFDMRGEERKEVRLGGGRWDIEELI